MKFALVSCREVGAPECATVQYSLNVGPSRIPPGWMLALFEVLVSIKLVGLVERMLVTGLVMNTGSPQALLRLAMMLWRPHQRLTHQTKADLSCTDGCQ